MLEAGGQLVSTTGDKALLTAAEFEALEAYYRERGDRVELIEGEVVTLSPIGPRNAACTERTHALLLRRLAGERALVRCQLPVRLSDLSEPQPDVAIVRFRSDHYENAHPGPDDILCLIEMADTSLRHDRLSKARVYAAAGVPEYLVVNLQDSVLELHRNPGPRGYTSVRLLRRGDRLTLLAFPDLAIELAELLPA